MFLFNLHKQPYFDADGGGSGSPIEPTATPAEPTATPSGEPVIPTEPPTEPTGPTPEPFLTVTYDKSDKPLTKEEAQTLAQKGMNYERAVERARQEARDAYIAEQGLEWNGKPITTEAQYKQALREQELQKQGIDPSIIAKQIEEHPAVLQARQYAQQAQKGDFKDKPFFAELEPEVDKMLANNPGLDTGTAYSYLLGQKMINGGVDALTAPMNERIAKLEETLQIRQKNEQNKESSPGSVTGNGDIPTGYFSRDQIEKMSTKDIKSNLDAIMASMKKRV